MTGRDWASLAMAIAGCGCVALFYGMVVAARRDVYLGDERRSIRLMQMGTIVMQLFAAAMACWIASFI